MKKRRFVTTIADVGILVNYKKKFFINIYIDNVIYAVKELQLLDTFEAQLKEKFALKLLSKVKLILSMLVKRNMKCKTLYLSHIYYIQDLLCIYNMIGANPIGTPIIKRSTLLFGKSNDTEFDVTDY